ncbi:hypothetical protein SAQ01S_06930 [Sphingomonas aquatilis NBRC 16722]|uniref:Carboxypeptidase regulatory-like domain-containing protein n=1 Tax=Sphingomonas aquatilis TaxID=93063 RepID=A0AAW3TSL8_9SPHN|nr:hypothetical protein [Sphingomonas aquatilis]MBB3876076.1 hypothetical protein [Sphingomonas aquatilis]GEM70927.1 hypothetical protein SAQ01S_06930 [Sphingomonas aquatilis NBRC 16722]
MLKYDNTVSSQVDGKPIYGAQVSVYSADGSLATLYSDEAGTTLLSQPVLTDQLGYFAFYIGDGKYDIRVMTGVVEISRTNITMVDTLTLKDRALLVPQNEDAGTLPAAGQRKGLLLGFDSSTGSPTALVPNSFAGNTGPANSTYTSLASLKAAPVTNASYIFAPPGGVEGSTTAGTFLYQTAGSPYTADGVNIIKLDAVPLTTGALVRQGDEGITFQNPLGGPAIRRLLRDRNGETVKVTDYCNNAGSNDAENYQEMINLNPAQIDYPQGFEVLLEQQIALKSNQRHNFDRGSGITADVNDYALFGLGLTTGNIGTVNAPIVRGQREIQFTNTSGETLASGDMIQIVDVSNPSALVLEPQEVQVTTASLITVRDMINVDMPTAANIRIYKVYAPVETVLFDGYARISNVNAGGGGGGLRFNLARNIRLRKTILEDVRYIGASIENTIGFSSPDLTIRNVVATGLGFRSAKRINIQDFTASDLKSDEALTFFDNVLGINIANVNIHQYLFGQDPDGGTAGNNILFDRLCAAINMVNIQCVGSGTYSVFFNDRTINAAIDLFNLSRSNLGGIRTANNCRDIRVGTGTITDVVNTVHPSSGFGEANGQPCAGIMFDPSSSGCGVLGAVNGSRVASGRLVIDRQAAGDRALAYAPRLAAGVDRPVHGVTAASDIGAVSPSFVGPSDPAGRSPAGNVVSMGADETSAWVQAGQAGGTQPRPLFLNPFGGTLVKQNPSFPSNGDARAAGLGPGEWYRLTTTNAITEVV